MSIMSMDEYLEAKRLILDNRYRYVVGKKPIPQHVARVLMSFYLWPFEEEEEFNLTDERRLEYINSHA